MQKHLSSELQSAFLKSSDQFKDSSYFNMQSFRYRKLLSYVESYKTGRRVLDVGAAPGHMSVTLAEAGYNVTGIVMNLDEYWEPDQRQFARQFQEASVAIVRADIANEPFPLPDKSFDTVLFTEVLEHIGTFPLNVMKEIFRVLAPGGIMILTTPNVWHLSNRIRCIFGKTPFVSLEDMISLPVHMRHSREYKKAEVETLVTMGGFEIVRSEYRNWHLWVTMNPETSRFENRFRLISWHQLGKLLINPIKMIIPCVRDSILIVARRPQIT